MTGIITMIVVVACIWVAAVGTAIAKDDFFI